MQKYGQHFLKNTGVADKIIEAVKENLRGEIVEIGPGKGFITERLLQLKPNLKVVEIDPEMAQYLQKNFPAKLDIINQDFLKFDLTTLGNGPVTFVSNLPYIDAAEILLKVLESPNFESAVFMFQREQAQRILAQTNAQGYGPLSILAQALAEVKSVCRVSKGSFNPPPKVESEVLLFTKQHSAGPQYFKLKNFTRKAFAYKRKTIYNSLLLSHIDGEKAQAALAELKLSSKLRPEEIDKITYSLLANIIE